MTDLHWMRLALRLARKGYGRTSPNPMVGAVLVKGDAEIGRGWHRCAGAAHAEIDALHQAAQRGIDPAGATLYVTLEPCSTHGRTPPCTEAIGAAGIRRLVIGAIDPNPRHAGRGLLLLQQCGIKVERGILEAQCARLNEAFNHWIVHRTPLVTVKAAMTLDGKIATSGGESKWISGEPARQHAMRLRLGHDAILVGVNTVLADDPQLTVRWGKTTPPNLLSPPTRNQSHRRIRRIILDSRARTPLQARVVTNDPRHITTIVVGNRAPAKRVAALRRQVEVLVAPSAQGRIDLAWLLDHLGTHKVTSLLVEGGGAVHAAFLLGGFAHRIAFYYAPKILGGAQDLKAVAGVGARSWNEIVRLAEIQWRRLGSDLLLAAAVLPPEGHLPALRRLASPPSPA